jgi:hypothetical protein
MSSYFGPLYDDALVNNQWQTVVSSASQSRLHPAGMLMFDKEA